MTAKDALRSLPQVGALLELEPVKGLIEKHGRTHVGAAARSAVERVRQAIIQGAGPPQSASWPQLVSGELQRRLRPRLEPVLNATGIVLHTNLGRSRLAAEAARAAQRCAVSYSTLEYDLERGERGSRHDLVRELLIEATGAQDAFAVNNNAGAVLLALAALAGDKQVIVSRGQLVEIGGSFRIPEVMAASGAQMVEVGSTNKTHLSDYRQAIGPDTALLLRAHTSNYRIVGFTQEVSRGELTALGREHGLPLVEDLGSGCLIDLAQWGLGDEPTARQVLDEGVDLVTFSGDKLLGGPQAGILAGKSELIARCKRHPLARALRLDKMTLAALEATLRLSLDPQTAIREVPTLAALTIDPTQLQQRAARLVELLASLPQGAAKLEIVDETSRAGGGALPLIELPTRAVAIEPLAVSVDELAARLRRGDPPLIARISRERLLLDPRTLEPHELEPAALALIAALRFEA
ncbi:MAG: L-seryl-tRNA(Sec) selenium transferase [Candidatus Alcyoniella australis]|nr:L-seryl-tRNA(Sec) selenium transferase [Candidatus Alcyoniella australis]